MLDQNFWKLAYQICFYTIQDNYLIYFQYRVLNRILGIKYIRKKMGLASNDICSLCHKDTETLLHLFCSCEKSSNLWKEISRWINNKTSIPIQFDPLMIIIGYTNINNISPTMNLIIMITKNYLFHCSNKNVSPNIFSVIERIRQSYNFISEYIYIYIHTYKLSFNYIQEKYGSGKLCKEMEYV